MKEDKSLVLYCLDDVTSLNSIIIHRLGCNNGSRAVLFTVHAINKVPDISVNLKKYKIFDDVVELPLIIRDDGKEELTENDIIEYFDNIFSISGYSLDQFKEIYITNDNWAGHIAVYLNLIKHKYIWLEVTKNRINIEPLDRSPKNMQPWVKLLNRCKYKYLIALSVKDTNGDKLLPNEIEGINQVGFKSYAGTGSIMYVGLIYKDKTLFDESGAGRAFPVFCEDKISIPDYAT